MTHGRAKRNAGSGKDEEWTTRSRAAGGWSTKGRALRGRKEWYRFTFFDIEKTYPRAPLRNVGGDETQGV
eukprot:1921643-Lingulodinium_polyedra.AAC.1